MGQKWLNDDSQYTNIIMNTVLDGLIIIDKKGTVMSFNHSAVKIFGYEAEEVIGQNVKMLMPDPYKSEHDGYLSNYLSTGKAKVIGAGREVSARKKDGTIFPIELGVNKMVIDDEIMFVGTIRDISEKKESEERIHKYLAWIEEEKGKLNAIMENTVDGMVVIDEKGNIESFNRASEEIFGYTSDEVIGQNVKILMPNPYHDEHDTYLKNYKDTGERKVIGIGREVIGRKKDGSVFPIELAVGEVKLGSRRIFSGILRDISERKEAEKQIAKHVKALNHSNQELDDFAYIASHDLKEPLRGLSNNALFLQEDYEDQLDESAVKRLNRIVFLCGRMEKLIDSLLYFSRLGRQELAFKKVDIKSKVKGLLKEIGLLVKENNAMVTYDESIPSDVICDSVRIAEVIRNLITNAIKYNESEKKTIEIGYLPGCEVQRKGIKESDHIFYVKDNGIGISKEHYEDVFRIFKRLNTEEDDVRGSGVGLTFVKKNYRASRR